MKTALHIESLRDRNDSSLVLTGEAGAEALSSPGEAGPLTLGCALSKEPKLMRKLRK